MPDRDHLLQRLDGSLAAIGSLRNRFDEVMDVVAAVVATISDGGTVYTCGNGGSAAQALHLAEELIGRYRGDRQALRAVCLNADPTALTCIANDFGFDQVFARPCTALLSPGDALVALSTSGKSANVINALAVAHTRQVKTIGLLGGDGGPARAACDHAIVVDAQDSAHIQDAHQVVLHLICEALEGRSGDKGASGMGASGMGGMG